METKKFNVISYDNATHEFTDYDVIPFFVDKYKEIKRGKPITFDDFGEFINECLTSHRSLACGI